MRIEPWEDKRPISPWLPVIEDRRYVLENAPVSARLPTVNQEDCVLCGLCWIYCPEGAISMSADKLLFDLADCRGCGLCAHECPRNAIEMERVE